MAGEDNFYPGVQIIERPFQSGQRLTAEAVATGAFIGKSNQGSTTPRLVRSWSDFVSQYGSTYTDLHNAVNDFFANGGQAQAYIQRIVGANASLASVNIYATDAPMDPGNPGQVLPGTTPLFTVETLNPGAWGNTIHAVVYARDTVNKRFDLSLFKVPSTVVFDYTKRNSEYLVDSWIDLSLDASDGRYLYDIVNAPSASGSSLVRVTGQSYNPATPLVRPFPMYLGDHPLVGGVDGSYADVSYDNDAAYQAGITAMADVPGPFVLNIPNVTDADILRYAVTTAVARGDIFVVIDPPQGRTSAEMVTYVDTDLGFGTLGVSTPSHAAVYYPWLYMPSLGALSAGKVTLRPPGGAVVGLYMANDTTYGPGRAPAGIETRVAGAVAGERTLTQTDLTRLNNAHINAIRPETGAGLVVMGARTLKRSGLDRYINVRREVIYLRETLKRATMFAAFRPNGDPLWEDVASVCRNILAAEWQRGGLKGATASEAFFVRCDSSNNVPASIEAGFVNVEVGIAPSTPAEFIVIAIGQFDGGTNVTVTGI